MSRKKHKRHNKPAGQNLAPQSAPEPTQNITRYKAVVRSPLGQWWFDNKKRVRIFSMVGGGAIIFVYLIFELLRLLFGA